MKGDIAEILIYNTALSALDRVAVVNYLATKYNIQNLPPTVSLKTSPAGPNAAVGTTITATATATDSDGTVASVQFFINGGLFATATAPPYSARAVLETGGSYVLTARAFDEKGAQATSLPITLTVGATSAPALAVTNSLQLWLKADAGVTAGGDGAVSAWTDSSGKGNSALQGDPTQAPALIGNALNGKAVLRFDGDNDYLEVADSESVSIAGDITSLFVVKMDDFATFRAVWAKTAGNLPAPNDWYTVPGAGTPRLYRGDGTGSSLGSVDGAASLTAGAFQIAGFSAAGTAITHYLNGGKNGTGTIAATLADGDTSLLIGTRGDFFTKLKGDLAEILIYNTALSDSDRKQAELYLAGKYGLSIATPTNTPPTISLTAPVNGLTLSAPTNITVTATAADSDGDAPRIAQVRPDSVIRPRGQRPESECRQCHQGPA